MVDIGETAVAHWRVCAEAWLDDVVEHGDENGTIANLTGDDLRNVLVVAAEQIRLLHGGLREVLDATDQYLIDRNLYRLSVHCDGHSAPRALLLDRTGRGRVDDREATHPADEHYQRAATSSGRDAEADPCPCPDRLRAVDPFCPIHGHSGGYGQER